MKLKRLGDIIKITSGGTPLTSKREYYDSGTIPWAKTGDLKVRHLSKIPDSITQLGLENSSAKIFPKNTVLIAMYGATIGNCSILKTEAATNQACAALLPNEEVNEEFLFFFLSSIKSELINKGVGGGQPNISATILKEIKIPLPSLPDQIRIAEILNQAENLITQRKESIALLDELLKSSFLKMFIYSNENKNWLFTEVKNTVEKQKNAIKAGPFGSSLKKEFYVKKGYKIYGQEQVIKDDLNFGNYYINEDLYKKLESCKIKEGDILISLVGTYGKISVVPKKYEQGIINPRLMKISFDKNIINPIYFKNLFKSDYLLQQLSKLSRGGTMDIINSGIVKEIKVPVPPIELQNKFATIVQKVEVLKNEYQASLRELENMYGVLSQKAFKGELNLNK